jgi:hypothetical protein
VTQIDDDCLNLSQQGHGYLQQAIAQSSALSGINPAVDPALAGMANGLETFGSSYGPSLAPFGPFIAGTGAMIAFYEGS